MDGAQNCSVIGCSVKNTHLDGAHLQRVGAYYHAYESDHCVFSGNTLVGMNGVGFWLYGANADNQGMIVANNTIDTGAYSTDTSAVVGFRLDESINGGKVIGNIYVSALTDATSDYGYDICSRNSQFQNNTAIVPLTGVGLFIENNTGYNGDMLISNNYFAITGRGIRTASGDYENGTFVLRNNVYDVTSYGIDATTGAPTNLTWDIVGEYFISSSNPYYGVVPGGLYLTDIELGHATDTTLSRSAAGVLAVEGNIVLLNPMDSAGDMVYGGASGVQTKLDAGTSGQYLIAAGASAPVWTSQATLTSLEGLTLTAGNVLYATAADTLAVLAPGTSGQSLTPHGAAAPTWESARSLAETTTPTPVDSVGQIYTKSNNELYFQDGAGEEHTVHGPSVFKSYTIADAGNAGTFYLGGHYNAPAAHEILTIGGTVTRTLGTAGQAHGAHAFCVASGAGGTDLVLTVSGVSITDAGVRNDSDSEVIVADTDTATTNAYYETSKKWLGQVTYTLTGAAGAFTFNYGFAKYEDFGNRSFTLQDVEITGQVGASETGLDVEVLHHAADKFVYSAAGFNPNATAAYKMSTDYGTNNDVANGEYFAWKRSGLALSVAGSDSEGVILRITNAVNNSIDYFNAHVGVQY